MKDSLHVAEILLKYKAFAISKDGPVTFASGIKSPVYCDNRLLISKPTARRTIVDEFCKIAQTEGNVDAVAGTATAGIPWAAWTAEKLNLPMFYVRSKPKEHGKGKTVEGGNVRGLTVLLIEDLITTGGSSFTAAGYLKEEGAKVAAIAAIFSYGFKKAEAKSKEEGIEIYPLTTLDDLLKTAENEKIFTTEELAEIKKFKSDPWGY